MKKTIQTKFLYVIGFLILHSCGNKNNETSNVDTVTTVAKTENLNEFSTLCTDSNAIAVTIKNYNYGMSGEYTFNVTNFEVKHSTWMITSDTTADLKLCNYTPAEWEGDRKDNQVDILVTFRTIKGEKLTSGVYTYNSDESKKTTLVALSTSKGTVYFNWMAGMPKQGYVELTYVGADGVCGTFNLASEKPENRTIGIVRLNGKFTVKK